MQQLYIALVDDDEDDVFFLKGCFEKYAIPIKSFKTSNSFIDHLDASNGDYPCLLVTDLNIPEVCGIDLIKQLKAHSLYKSIPIMVYTTGATPMEQAYCDSQHIEVFKKPNAVKEWDNIAFVMARHCELYNKDISA